MIIFISPPHLLFFFALFVFFCLFILSFSITSSFKGFYSYLPFSISLHRLIHTHSLSLSAADLIYTVALLVGKLNRARGRVLISHVKIAEKINHANTHTYRQSDTWQTFMLFSYTHTPKLVSLSEKHFCLPGITTHKHTM